MLRLRSAGRQLSKSLGPPACPLGCDRACTMAHPSTPSLGDVTVFCQRRYPLSGARPSSARRAGFSISVAPWIALAVILFPSFAQEAAHRAASQKRGSIRVSRRTSSVGRGCEALPLWPRWEWSGDDDASYGSASARRLSSEGLSRAILAIFTLDGPLPLSTGGERRMPPFTWLILPVVICLSQRLSHASVSTCCQMAKPRTPH